MHIHTHTHTHTQDFEQTLSLVSEYRFPSLFINQFYPRPGTPAARMRRIPTQEVRQYPQQLLFGNTGCLSWHTSSCPPPHTQVKRRSRLLSRLFQSYRPYDHKLGERQCVLVTEESHDGVHYVAHNTFYEQVRLRTFTHRSHSIHYPGD